MQANSEKPVKKNLLVTLADRNYIPQVKQLFSSVYWNAGWDGDYMLLAHDIPENELEWFREKGIFVKKCEPLRLDKIGMGHNPIILDKFYIFTTEFKKWDHIVFMDSDIIVNGSLNKLTKLKGMGAICSSIRLSKHFSGAQAQIAEIKNRYKYNNWKKSFNSGVMAFPTSIIHDDLLAELLNLYDKYDVITNCNEESILNLFFYKKWKKLPRVYNNLHVSFFTFHNLKFMRIPTIVNHFMGIFLDGRYINGYRPWLSENPFHREWCLNLDKAESIDLRIKQHGNEWHPCNIYFFSFLINSAEFISFSFIKIRYSFLCRSIKDLFHIIKKAHTNLLFRLKSLIIKFLGFLMNFPLWILGKAGLFLKKHNRDLYNRLKKTKSGK